MHIIIYGPEGSGKGTQAKILSERFDLPVFTSGDLVRETAEKDGGDLGEACRYALREGKYVPDKEMYQLWKNILGTQNAQKGFVLDGFPRTVSQAEFLLREITNLDYSIDRVIYLNLSDEEAVKRLALRGRKLFSGSEINHDAPERVKQRLKVYREQEKALLEFFRKKGILSEIDADKSIAQVADDIARTLPLSDNHAKPTILILVGLPGCGKTTASAFFKDRNIPVVRMGDVTDEVLKEKSLSFNAKNEKKIREELRSGYGDDIYAKKTVDKILPLLKNSSFVVIDGMRSEAEYAYFKKHLPEVKLVFCEALEAIRYQRLTQRKDRPLNEAEARERDMSELSRLGLHTLRKSADFIIHNNGTKEQLFSGLDSMFKELNKK